MMLLFLSSTDLLIVGILAELLQILMYGPFDATSIPEVAFPAEDRVGISRTLAELLKILM
jgi:hypothetical protein